MSSSQVVGLIIVILIFVLVGVINRSDEKRRKAVKTKAQEESSPNDYMMPSGGDHLIFSEGINDAGAGEQAPLIKSANVRGGHPVRDRRCPQCDHVIPYFELKCGECGCWLDNDVFRKLNESEIALIKSRGLSITTPSLISIQNGGFVKLIGNELKDYLRNTKTTSTSLLVSLYFLHAFAFSINLSVQKQSGKEELLHQDLYETMIENYGSGASSLAPQLFECSLEEFQKMGVWLFSQLDSIWYGEGPGDLSPASLFMVSEKIGKIILPDKNSIPMNLVLFSRHVEISREFSTKYSNLFMVEDDDFECIKMLET